MQMWQSIQWARGSQPLPFLFRVQPLKFCYIFLCLQVGLFLNIINREENLLHERRFQCLSFPVHLWVENSNHKGTEVCLHDFRQEELTKSLNVLIYFS